MREMPELSKLCLYSNLILTPGMLILLFYAVNGNVLNIPCTYLVMDCVIFLVMLRHERVRRAYQKREEEEETSGRALESTLQNLEQLRKIEAK